MRGGIDRRGLTAICCMLLAAAVGTACGEDADTASTGNGGQLASRDYKVNIVAGAYKPARLRVRVGDTVSWINRGEAPNTAENHT